MERTDEMDELQHREQSSRLKTLQRLPAITASQAEAAVLDAKHAMPTRDDGSIAYKRAEWDLRIAKRQLAAILERDELIAGGACASCLGLAHHTEPDGRFGETIVPCPNCDAGRALAIDIAARRAAARAARVTLLLDASGMPARYASLSFETFPVSPETAAAAATVESWTGEDGVGLFLTGDFGRGKTGLAVSALRAFIEREPRRALFIHLAEWLEGLRQEIEGHEEAQFSLEDCTTAPLLVIDDIGAERLTDWGREKILLLVNARHSRMLPTIATSNLTLLDLTEHLGQRIVWRLYEAMDIVKLDGPNLRLTNRGRRI